MNNSPPARHLCKLTALAVTVSSRQASQQQVDGAPGPASVAPCRTRPGRVGGTLFGESND
jgi:hypothetical protein